MLYKVALIFESLDEIIKCDNSNESYWRVLSCGTVYYAVQRGSNFESVDEILECGHLNESYWAVFSCGTVYYAVQVGSNFRAGGCNPQRNHSNKSYWVVPCADMNITYCLCPITD